jgi:site-specific DNA recombinase
MNVFYPPHSKLTPGSLVVAYLRDSGGTNQEESIDRQEAEVRRWCDEYNLVLTTVYVDEAKTANHSLHKRKDLLSMMAYLNDGAEEKGVVIWNYERFARNIKHGRHFLAEIESLDKVICSLTDNIPEGPERYIIQDLKLWSAEQTSVKIAIDVTSGLRKMVSQHRGVPGIPPRGFKRGDPITIGKHRDGSPRIVHAWEPDPELIPTIRLAFELRARGATIKQIIEATHLFPVVNSWRTFFNNHIYIGILQYGDLIIEDYCEPIVPIEIWKKVQEVGKVHARITKENNPRRAGSSFLLSGLVFCQHCGSLLNGRVIKDDGRRSEYYYCLAKDRGRDCASRMIPARLFEDTIIAKLENVALDLERLINFQARMMSFYNQESDKIKGERSRLRRELSLQSRRIKNLTDAIAERGQSRALLVSLDKAEMEEATLRAQLDHIENSLIPPPNHSPIKLSQLADELKDALHGDNIHKKKHAIYMLATRIIAMRSGQEINAVLYYLPTVCVGSGAPTEESTVSIQIIIPRYVKVRR